MSYSLAIIHMLWMIVDNWQQLATISCSIYKWSNHEWAVVTIICLILSYQLAINQPNNSSIIQCLTVWQSFICYEWLSAVGSSWQKSAGQLFITLPLKWPLTKNSILFLIIIWSGSERYHVLVFLINCGLDQVQFAKYIRVSIAQIYGTSRP